VLAGVQVKDYCLNNICSAIKSWVLLTMNVYIAGNPALLYHPVNIPAWPALGETCGERRQKVLFYPGIGTWRTYPTLRNAHPNT
jgi:hypothetical protein